MQTYFADFHIHIGRTEKGTPVKISASSDLTFHHIAKEAAERKGLHMIGIIDCQSPSVQEEIMHYLHKGDMVELPGGGIRYQQTTILLGSEIEVRDPGMGPAHVLAYLPDLDAMQQFTGWMKAYMKNVELSSQRIYVPAKVLQEEVAGRGGFLIPAHIFTPHRSVYGSCAPSMADLLEMDSIAAVELGLSADTEMAGMLSELDRFAFLTNSDAHSLGKIAREYNQLRLEAPNFTEWSRALRGEADRAITANYGLNPKLGKYHRAYCASCQSVVEQVQEREERCAYCGSSKIVQGVYDRILQIADRQTPHVPASRPPYHYQIPLQFIPGLGPKKLDRLLDVLGTEMNILHHVQREQLAEHVGQEIADYIVLAREGQLHVQVGGGGKYGRVMELN